MPFSSILTRPGVNTVFTPTLNIAGISDSNLIRFRMNQVEKMGGWSRYAPSAMGSVTRALWAWQDLRLNKWLATGNLTSLKVVTTAGGVTDITPQSSTFSPAVSVTTVAGSRNVTITDASLTSTVTIYDCVYFNTPISIGGITLSGLYPISGPGAGVYIIQLASPAITSVAAGGAVPSFSVVAGTVDVTVTFANHNLSVGDDFYFPIPTIVGGITISGAVRVATVPTTSTFTFVAAEPATSTATGSMNGGNAQYVYFLSLDASGITSRLGPPGAIGQFPIGEGRVTTVSATAQTGTPITAANWSLDNWGEFLLANPRGGGIYYWQPNSGFQTGTLIGTAPPFCNGIFVAMPQQILVAWGSTTGNNNPIGGGDQRQDPLMVRWSDVLDFTNWTVNSTTQAGSFRIPTGSEIRGALQAPNQALIWTDVDVWAMQYIGYPLVFGFNKLATECGMVGPHAVASASGIVVWMNDNHFCILDGRGARPLQCPVWDTIFQDLDLSNKAKVCAGTNRAFSEIIFFYPSISGGTGECDKYVKWNYLDNVWDIGSMPRSAWIDQSVIGHPIGADPATQLIQQHEQGYDDDGAAMNAYYETGYFAIGDGENVAVIDHFQPDAKWQTVNGSSSAQLQVTLSSQIYPNDGVRTNPEMTMTSTATYLAPRLAGRQMKWRISSSDVGSWWRIGNIRYRWAVDGRR